MFGSVAGLLSAFNLANKRGGGGDEVYLPTGNIDAQHILFEGEYQTL
jgi:hypothetical protein